MSWGKGFPKVGGISPFPLSWSLGPVVQSCQKSCLTLCPPVDCSLPGSSVHGIFSGKSTGVGCHFLLQGIFPTQESNPHLLHWQVDSLLLSHPGSPWSPVAPKAKGLDVTPPPCPFSAGRVPDTCHVPWHHPAIPDHLCLAGLQPPGSACPHQGPGATGLPAGRGPPSHLLWHPLLPGSVQQRPDAEPRAGGQGPGGPGPLGGVCGPEHTHHVAGGPLCPWNRREGPRK